MGRMGRRMVRRKREVRFANRNHTGWWVFGEVEEWVSDRQRRGKVGPRSRVRVWENVRLIRARDREEAYRKAVRLGREGRPSRTDRGEFRFAGVSFLMPVYEEIEDGAEIMWNDHGWVTRGRVGRMVKGKRELPVFDDREGEGA